MALVDHITCKDLPVLSRRALERRARDGELSYLHDISPFRERPRPRRGLHTSVLMIRLARQSLKVEPMRVHREMAIGCTWPLVGRTVPVKFEAVLIGISQI